MKRPHPDSLNEQHHATWVRKSVEGKVWLTECRVKVRVLADDDYAFEYLCQMRDPVNLTWKVVQRCTREDAAMKWLYQS